MYMIAIGIKKISYKKHILFFIFNITKKDFPKGLIFYLVAPFLVNRKNSKVLFLLL